MKYFLISDNLDTLAGLRMVGVDGVIVQTPEEVQKALATAQADSEVGLVLVTSALFRENSAMIFDYKLHSRKPLIVEMPDRHSTGDVSGNIRQYIEEAVGIKIKD